MAFETHPPKSGVHATRIESELVKANL
ncbi:hypothetical protein CCACVL1_31031 [Corchorus capsularis]|uniref:Uncharacterized protein n=1 Tax=Corchorus capsularis TaxID=210143 RepID=A0A1R3FUA6_COCAP|nr:hypothetical protein CCACVL1_31031 [Corchorus capsularis]